MTQLDKILNIYTDITKKADCLTTTSSLLLMEPIGIEPMTSCVQSRRSPS